MFLHLNSVHICTHVWQTTRVVYQLYTTAAAFDLRCESVTYILVYPFEAIKQDFLPMHYKCCSFIKSCGKPTITSTTMKECHDNDKIEPHNHNEHPLLYKEAELLRSTLGRFLECRKWNVLVITWALRIFLIYICPRPSGLGIYIRQIPRAHVITITYMSQPDLKLLTGFKAG